MLIFVCISIFSPKQYRPTLLKENILNMLQRSKMDFSEVI